jgi:hypothetical protein
MDFERRVVMKKWVVLVCLGIGFFGCVRTMTDFAPFTSVTSPAGEEIVLTTGDIDRPYKELGVIVVRGKRASGEKIMELLRKEAKEVGADAVIKIDFSRRYYRRHCRGVAVSFK